jgi:peptidoglycan hydrolase-like protein with peptidoglycan-binding domain
VVDARVLEGQQWVNSTYGSVPGYVSCLEDGITGWATMYSLTMGLQHELGISPLAAAFGPTTMTQLTLHGDITPSEANTNIINIVRYGLWAKGYTGGFQSGVMDTWTVNSISDLRLDTGLDGAVISITPKLFKALLNMDAYVLLSGGSGEVREVQQWLNARYVNKSTFFVIPCDGHFSRGVQQALMKGIQYEVGIPEAQANGNFGPGTKAGLEAHPVSIGSSGVFVRLFSAACVCNGPVGGAAASFKNDFDGDLADWVRAFQTFCALDVTGSGNYRTWAELLVSMGDADRPASGCDTSFTITPSRATALYNAGYRYVGRYLENAPGSSLNKRIQPGELQAIFAANLRVFPIWQMGARSLSDFSRSTGNDDASAALLRAWIEYGFDRGTVIYFAVDYDATDEEITSNIIPYFEGVQYVLGRRAARLGDAGRLRHRGALQVPEGLVGSVSGSRRCRPGAGRRRRAALGARLRLGGRLVGRPGAGLHQPAGLHPARAHGRVCAPAGRRDRSRSRGWRRPGGSLT